MAVEIFIPKMSDHMESGEIVDWLAAEGDRVEAGQGVLEIMTDKVTAEVEAPASGVLYRTYASTLIFSPNLAKAPKGTCQDSGKEA